MVSTSAMRFLRLYWGSRATSGARCSFLESLGARECFQGKLPFRQQFGLKNKGTRCNRVPWGHWTTRTELLGSHSDHESKIPRECLFDFGHDDENTRIPSIFQHRDQNPIGIPKGLCYHDQEPKEFQMVLTPNYFSSRL